MALVSWCSEAADADAAAPAEAAEAAAVTDVVSDVPEVAPAATKEARNIAMDNNVPVFIASAKIMELLKYPLSLFRPTTARVHASVVPFLSAGSVATAAACFRTDMYDESKISFFS